MNESILSIAIFFFTGLAMAAGPIVLSFLLWRKRSKVKGQRSMVNSFDASKELEPYESGMTAVGSGRAVGFEYFIYAILFLLFDVIAVLLFLGAVALRQNKAAFIWPFLALAALAMLTIAYGVKKREYIKI